MGRFEIWITRFLWLVSVGWSAVALIYSAQEFGYLPSWARPIGELAEQAIHKFLAR